MGYNLSKGPCIRMERYLQDMANNRHDLRWVTVRPRSLAYKIREALHAAAHHEEYKHYAKLKYLYRFTEHEMAVEARYIGHEHTEPMIPEKIEVDLDITSAEGVVGAALKLQPVTDEIHFTKANLSDEEAGRLFKWTEQTPWHFIDHYDGTLTLTQKDVDPALVWRPDS